MRKNRLLIDGMADFNNEDSAMIACRKNMCNVVQLLDKYDNHNFKTMNALRCAITSNSVDVVEYLLNKYKYPLNDEYFIKDWMDDIKECYLLEEACGSHLSVVQLLLDHGAEVNKKFCYSSGIIIAAVRRHNTNIIALLIRDGADINYKSQFDFPFEFAVTLNQKCIAEMILISGCSRGLFSITKPKDTIRM